MRLERLSEHHDLSSFECGTKSLDDWLRNHAKENAARNLSRTFVLLNDADVVVGYYTLTMGGVHKEQLPPKLGRGLPLYELGMVLLARLAVAHDLQGQGYGRDLVIDAVRSAAIAGDYAAARFIAVDPVDGEAARFYVRFGFEEIPGDQRGRMFMRIDRAIATIAIDDQPLRDVH